jgi:predicted HTH transcriptional regulator
MSRRYVDLLPCDGAVLDDLDSALIEAYRQELERRRPGSAQLRQSNEELLIGVGAAVKVRRRLCPTLAGMLMFGRDPQHVYPAFTITFMHFAGT